LVRKAAQDVPLAQKLTVSLTLALGLWSSAAHRCVGESQ
jgi:hypothetical protein